MKKRILFVDDQPNVLAGLRRMLRGFRHEWEMVFAESGADALAILAGASFDVVVSDMRMPGMDGAQLLDEVMRRYPETVRIVLSGQSEHESIMRTVGPAHQFLSKPCDPETLKSTVARACALRDKLTAPSLQGLVARVTTLPSLPDIYTKLVDELQSPDATVRRVAELISKDVGMTAKLLQLVNSSFFGLPRRVESPSHAAALLGLELLGPLVLSASIFSEFEGTSANGYSLDAVVNHSLATSRLAQGIASLANKDKHLAEDSLLSGLLHDVGQLILLTNLPERYDEALTSARENQIPLFDAESETFGASHADVGAFLLGLWGLPDAIVEAVAFHHQPAKCPHTTFSPLTAVHVANALENEAEQSSDIMLSVEIDVDYLDRLNVAHLLPEWRQMARQFAGEEAPA